MAKKPDLSQEQIFQIKQRSLDRTADILALLIKCVMWIVIAYFALLATKALAGQSTSASLKLAVRWLSTERKETVTAWTVALFAILYGRSERNLRKRKTRYMQQRIRDLESKRDPSRSSSGLTESGETPEEEQL